MNLSTEQLHLAKPIDEHASRHPDNQIGNEQLLMTIYDYMDAFKRFMDSCSSVETDYLCLQYPGFYRFSELLGAMAQGIVNGEITVVPPEHPIVLKFLTICR